MINIDIENNPEDIKIQGVAEIILAQLAFVVSFLYIFLRRRKYETKDIREMILYAVDDGLQKGWDTQKEIKGLDGKEKFVQSGFG